MTDLDPRPPEDLDADLGFGSVVARESRRRLLNRDGSFNVRREGLSFWQTHSFYHHFVTMTWPTFLIYVVGAYVAVNSFFALAYVACGDDALTGFAGASAGRRFAIAFFFSVETIATIGFGNIAPLNPAAELLVTLEALMGLLGFGVAAAMMFARFARPAPQIVFSRNAVIGPYRDTNAFMFRIVNQKKNELVDLEAQVLLVRRKKEGTILDREFIRLKLERDGVVFFPLSWTVVHPIDRSSPLWGTTEQGLRTCDSEFLVRLSAFDETSSQSIHTRSSYKGDEIVWGARFINIFNPPQDDGTISVDIRKVHELERVALK